MNRQLYQHQVSVNVHLILRLGDDTVGPEILIAGHQVAGAT